MMIDVGFSLRPFAVAFLVGCNILSGADQFHLEADASAPPLGTSGDAGTPDPSSPPTTEDAAGHEDAGVVCARGLVDCNGDAADGCEVDVQRDRSNCGSCGAVCTVLGASCVGGQCGPPPSSCNVLLAVTPGTPSGSYLLDPDGNGPNAPFSAQCDMTTEGGGWTIVFPGDGTGENRLTLDYSVKDASLWSQASETLLANRDLNQAPIGTTAAFVLPSSWRTTAPFQVEAQDINAIMSLDGVRSTHVLRYGYGNFSTYCKDAWTEGNTFGRLCIEGTSAPYYAGFAAGGTDFCSTSASSYNAYSCSPQRHFTIAIR
jgi:hypothetical protein